MKLSEVKPGLRVRIVQLGSTRGMFIAKEHLQVRKVGVTGTIKSWVPGHGGDVWWVKHDNSDEIGAYVFDEFEPLDE